MPTTYLPAPLPAGTTALAERLVRVALLVPPALWASYGDVAEAVGTGPRAAASCLSSLHVMPTPGADFDVSDWRIGWHRLRNADGVLLSRTAEPERAARLAKGDALWLAEGGRMRPGSTTQADPALRYRLVRHVAELRAAGWQL